MTGRTPLRHGIPLHGPRPGLRCTRRTRHTLRRRTTLRRTRAGNSRGGGRGTRLRPTVTLTGRR
ncbi:MAG: hypothetical protein DIU60_001675, partial [Actinomycetes bacterium]